MGKKISIYRIEDPKTGLGYYSAPFDMKGADAKAAPEVQRPHPGPAADGEPLHAVMPLPGLEPTKPEHFRALKMKAIADRHGLEFVPYSSYMRMSEVKWSNRWFYGFTSLEALKKWFSNVFDVCSKGLRVVQYEVDEDDVLEGESQCVFIRPVFWQTIGDAAISKPQYGTPVSEDVLIKLGWPDPMVFARVKTAVMRLAA